MLNLTKVFRGIAGAVPRIGSILGLQVPTIEVTGVANFKQVQEDVGTLVDGANIAVDATVSSYFKLTCASNAARVIGVPTNGVVGQEIDIQVFNTSGGNLTLTTFAAGIKQPALTYPATANNRMFHLRFDGTTWFLYDQSTNNIPN